MEEHQWLSCLNENQRKAVEQPSDGGLQILAGPGSGKTRVLTCRVAYLLKQCGIPPAGLVAVTFTNKAANEMKNRLIKLLGAPLVNEVVLGTFHGMCVGFLRKHGTKIGLKSNWLICDRDQQIHYCKTILKDAKLIGQLKEDNLSVKPKTLLDSISRAKSQGLSPEALLQQSETSHQKLMAMMFRSYADLLAADNCLDFDDLLLFGERLFRSHPAVIGHIQHVLIDEFQDTNTVQYQIMILLAHRGAVTVVGDPDQGIYGFRHAQVINLEKMTKDIPNTQVVFLEENYRSSSSILKASLAVVQQDQERIDKNLYTTHPKVSIPMLRPFENPQEEAGFIAQEIHRLVAHTGGQLGFNDFCILMRYNALSRNLEAAMKLAGIPIRMIGAQKFFERAEVKDILAYLQLADNTAFGPAFERVLNTPKRNFGLATMNAIKAAAQTHKISYIEVLLKVVRGEDFPGLKSGQVVPFRKFLSIIYNIQKMAQERSTVAEIIDSLLEQTHYADYLQKSFGPESVQRDQNIQELKAFATHLAEESPIPPSSSISRTKESPNSSPKPDSHSQVALSNPGLHRLESIIESIQNTPDPDEVTPLRHFLIQSSLSTDADAEASKDDKNTPRVTICTCHSSKGLEWPVVFVVAVEDGIFPFYLCNEPEEVKEERRLLFVAMTRAQGILYLTHSATRMQGAETRSQELSIFLKKLVKNQQKGEKPSPDSFFTQSLPWVNEATRGELSAVINRQTVVENDVEKKIQEYESKDRKTFTIPNGNGRRFGSQQENRKPNYNRWGNGNSKPSLGRFSSSSSGSPAAHISFQGKFQTVGSAPRFRFSDPTGQSLNKPLEVKNGGQIGPTIGKVSAPLVRALPQPRKPFKTSSLHQPFIPPKPNNGIKTECVDQKVEPVDAGSHPGESSAENQGLDKLKALSHAFLPDLKDDIPEEIPAEDPTKPSPLRTSTRIRAIQARDPQPVKYKQTREPKPRTKRVSDEGFLTADKKIKSEL